MLKEVVKNRSSWGLIRYQIRYILLLILLGSTVIFGFLFSIITDFIININCDTMPRIVSRDLGSGFG